MSSGSSASLHLPWWVRAVLSIALILGAASCGSKVEAGVLCVVRVSGPGYLNVQSPTVVTDVTIQVYGKRSAAGLWEQTALVTRHIERGALPIVYGMVPREKDTSRLYMTVVTLLHNTEELEQKIAIGSFPRGRVGVLEFAFVSGSLCYKKFCVDDEGEFLRATPCEDQRTECIQACNPDLGDCEMAVFMRGEDLEQYDEENPPEGVIRDGGVEAGEEDAADAADDADAVEDADAEIDGDARPPVECGPDFPSCDDGNACTTDRCSSTGRCEFTSMCRDPDPNDCVDTVCDPSGESPECVTVTRDDGDTCGAGDARTCCNTQCVETDTNASHCGACGRTCGAAATCESGSCSCGSGRLDCTDEPGCETDPLTDEQFCGATTSPCGGVACATGTSCIEGTCQSCSTDAECNDGLTCTVDACTAGSCTNVLDAGACQIEGQCYADGESNPFEACGKCAVAVSQTAWSPDPGAVCSDGQFCTTEVCGDSGTGQAACVTTPRSCSDGLTCTTDTCSESLDRCDYSLPATQCAIETTAGMVCAGMGAMNPANPCEACDPTRNQFAYSPRTGATCNDGLYCTTGDICSATAVCTGTARSCDDSRACTNDTCNETADRCDHPVASGRCLIDGMCYSNGAQSGPSGDMRCQVCNPATSTTSFSAGNEGVDCGTDMLCETGSCVEGEPEPGYCGDGTFTSSEGEDCDDGNYYGGDGCNSCDVEAGWMCAGSPSVCVDAGCGDGYRRGTDQCDDGNTVGGDGCSSVCQQETGWYCYGEGVGSCSPSCGDGTIVGSETCDDGPWYYSDYSGDGCYQCQVEAGWDCDESGCHDEACGDGQNHFGDYMRCDDGDTTSGDGCSATCYVEAGWSCYGGGATSCSTNCGDGTIVGTEQCDDGPWYYSDYTGDGCYQCVVEAGWDCDEDGCHDELCGDGQNHFGDYMRCDDGGTVNGDGCSSTCYVETGWSCYGGGATSCTANCGDGAIHGPEQCDDGPWYYSDYTGDGCYQCVIETGWDCTEDGCYDELCGDGLNNFGDYMRCDDGNNVDGDGCSATCGVEEGWSCYGGGAASCTTNCGDGIIRGGETCDDGPWYYYGDYPGDGCYQCQVEAHWDCDEEGCEDELCGDGYNNFGDYMRCDDGNNIDGDGCTSGCNVEVGWSCSGGGATSCSPNCGDGTIRGGETCDDGPWYYYGDYPGDGCYQCQIEAHWDCDEDGCRDEQCGDGYNNFGDYMRCDDGNNTSGDGCSATCNVEEGWSCNGGGATSCNANCGDGIIRGGETCDDGPWYYGDYPGDGCYQCQIEAHWDCDEDGCQDEQCGDGYNNFNDYMRCDDGNNTAGDGCSATCNVETGWSCYGGGATSCTANCGDGTIVGGETCDDGPWYYGDYPGDGCYQCQIEAHWDCDEDGCHDELCGDGYNNFNDYMRCDDGDTASGDGCSATCYVESGWSCSGGGATSCSTYCGDGLIRGSETCDDGPFYYGDYPGDGCYGCMQESGWTCAGEPSSCSM